MMNIKGNYEPALYLAASRHEGQCVPGTQLPYLVHVCRVALEVMAAGFNTNGFDIDFGVIVALLHDSMEDTETSFQEIREKFGERVAEAVLALTKFDNLEKSFQIENSVDRIKQLSKEVWAVKLADRITNLDAPPLDWNEEKRRHYYEDASFILTELGEANLFLADKLKEKIKEYATYVVTGEK